MKSYRNKSGKSGVLSYDTGPDWISIQFSGGIYKYSYNRAGKYHVEKMKILAQNGNGLATYINKYVKGLFD